MAQSLLTRIKTNAANRNKNANATLHILVDTFTAYQTSGDWTNLAWVVSLATGADKKRLAAIIQATAGVTFRADAKQPTGLKIATKPGETNRLALLAAYAESGVSFRSTALENDDDLPALLDGAAAPKLRTVEEIVLAAVRKARKDNPDTATDVRIQEALRVALAAD